MYEFLAEELNRTYKTGCRSAKCSSKESVNMILLRADSGIYKTIKEWADNEGINFIRWDVAEWNGAELEENLNKIQSLDNTVLFIEGMDDRIRDDYVFENLRGLVKERSCFGRVFYSLPMTIINNSSNYQFDNGLKSACIIHDCGKIVLNNHICVATSTKIVNGRIIRRFPINPNNLNDVELEIKNHPTYGVDDTLLNSVLNNYPNNTDSNIVAMKIALIDVTNSTHLSQHKSKVSISKLAKHIVGITEFDNRVAAGDESLVGDILKFSEDINLFSFASKYCHLHNRHIHNGDAYPKYDGIVAKSLPLYLEGSKYKYKDKTRKVAYNLIDTIRNNRDYPAFKEIIDLLIDNEGLTGIPGIRAKLDHFIWYTNR